LIRSIALRLFILSFLVRAIWKQLQEIGGFFVSATIAV